MAKPVITATECIINLLELGICTSLFIHVYFIRCNKFNSWCSSVIWSSFCIYRFDCTLYANDSLYFRKQYVNLINFLPYLNLMKCHLPFSLHTGYNNTTNDTKNWSIKFLLIRRQVCRIHFMHIWILDVLEIWNTLLPTFAWALHITLDNKSVHLK